jgi:hypothetical protein
MPASEVQEEFTMMKAQIEFEKNRELLSYRKISKTYRHRVLV